MIGVIQVMGVCVSDGSDRDDVSDRGDGGNRSDIGGRGGGSNASDFSDVKWYKT